MDSMTHDKRVEMASLSDVSSTTTTTTKSPGRARRVSMKIKKGLKEVKERLSPHHHHHPEREQRRRKSGPNESPRGPLAPVLDHLEKDKLVPIHLHISHTGSVSLSRKHSCSSLSHSLSTLEEPRVAMPTPPEPIVYVSPPSPHPPEYGQESGPDPFLVEDPKEPLSDPETTTEEPTSPPAPPPPDVIPSEPVVLTPATPAQTLPPVNIPAAPFVDEKPVPASPHGSETASETEVPAVYLPQLVMPTMFLPIPNVRISSPLTWWLTRRTSVYY